MKQNEDSTLLIDINYISIFYNVGLENSLISLLVGDVEFKPSMTLNDLDDEETIAQAEAEDNQDQDEISDLKKQSELDINDVIRSLPPGWFENL